MWWRRLWQGKWLGDQALKLNQNLKQTATGGEAEPVARESWWEVIYGNTVQGAGRAEELGVALQALVKYRMLVRYIKS